MWGWLEILIESRIGAGWRYRMRGERDDEGEGGELQHSR